VYDPAWLQQLVRVLRIPGRVIVVEMASFDTSTPGSRLLEWLYRVTGQRGPSPDLPAMLQSVGLCARRETIAVDGTSASLIVAEWPADTREKPSNSAQQV
jgi:ubiquinone/menaquinone biosynthesis C-methylase UbiE